MSPRKRDDWYSSTPKKPPPEHGIRIKKAGTTWWGQRWLEALEQVLGADAGRLARGRTYARAGRAHDLHVEGGRVTAMVTGSRPTPYEVVIQLTQLDESAWSRAIDGMAQKARFSAALLAGEMPRTIDEVFRAADVPLFPHRRTDLETECSCPDWGDPCKHVAATYYVLGEALDRDPFLLFELRGKTKSQLKEALRAARSSTQPLAPDPGAEPEIPSVRLSKLKAKDYDMPREALPSLHFDFDAPLAQGAVLRQLGTPAAWSSDSSPAEVFAPLLRAAADSARRIAMAEEKPLEPAPEPEKPPRKPGAKRRAR